MDSRATEWRLIGGMFGSHHIYERRLADGTRLSAHVRGDGGAPRVVFLGVERVPVSATVLRQAGIDALESAVSEETLGDLPRFLAEWCGISPRERVRRSRGRPRRRTDEELRDLVETVLARQQTGVNATDLRGVAPWYLSSRHVRDMLTDAASRGLVTVAHAKGRANVYSPTTGD
jgi:hypothetical protein